MCGIHGYWARAFSRLVGIYNTGHENYILTQKILRSKLRIQIPIFCFWKKDSHVFAFPKPCQSLFSRILATSLIPWGKNFKNALLKKLVFFVIKIRIEIASAWGPWWPPFFSWVGGQLEVCCYSVFLKGEACLWYEWENCEWNKRYKGEKSNWDFCVEFAVWKLLIERVRENNICGI